MAEPLESQAAETEQITIPLEKFSKQGKRVLDLAEEEARSFRHNYLGTEHLLLGLLRSESLAAEVLAGQGVMLEMVRMAVEQVIGYGKEEFEGRLKPVPRAVSVLSMAVSEAWSLHQKWVGPEALLLALVREGGGVGMRILGTLGIENEKLRTLIFQAMQTASGAPAESAPAPKSAVIACRIEKRDLDSIDALIEAGVRSTRSDAAAWLIHAGIEANKTLFEKVEGTVAEIRRLRNSVQQMIQESGQKETQAGEAEQA